MYLLIDIGNTRTKYGCHDGQSWLCRGIQAEETLALPEGFRPVRILASCVAGAEAAQTLRERLAPLGAPVEFLEASSDDAGFQCAYENPSKLGPDRWAAAIGAWDRVRGDCLVVNAGTATTIDLVRSPRRFEGGVILPGLSLMRESLSQGTARLPLTGGEFRLPARNTQDAIQSGCLLAQLGAIREMTRLLPPGSPVLLSGGNAQTLKAHLDLPSQYHPWLVLDGLLSIVQRST